MAGHADALFEQLTVALYVLCAVFAAVHALLTKPDPRSALGWIVTCWLLPFAGTVLYLLFGVNRVRTRARQLRAGQTTFGGGDLQPAAGGLRGAADPASAIP